MRWRILLEEYGPKIIYIKGIHNTVVYAISRLEYNPKLSPVKDNQAKLVMLIRISKIYQKYTLWN